MARITPLHLIPALIAAASHAGEITIERRPFHIDRTVSATVLPDPGGCQLVRLDPAAWGDFTIIDIAAHGASVKKGETLVRFETDEIDRKLVDSRRALESGRLALAQAEQEAKLREETTPHKLEAARKAA
ncbi:MAG: hypothetical protein EOP85_18450, partial [Verrucomicrobiaceae bacterium]